jgi:OOP family OmpA-OmpF porin
MNGFAFIFLFFSAWFLQFGMQAQNLVPNGSFEDYGVCPGSYSREAAEFRVPGWRPISTGSPDYFNTCSEGEAAVPYNWAGVSEAFDGHGYAGIYTWMDLARNYREYLHCKLQQPLLKDSVYHVEFRYKLSSYSKYSTDRIGLLLSDSLARFPHDRPLNIRPSVTFLKDSALDLETGAWERAVTEYRAKGDEQYLTIGNFDDNAETHHYYIRFRPASEPMLEKSAYYYIDDVKVIPLFLTVPEIATPPVFTGREPELNTIYILRNIRFEFNSYALIPVSYQDLDKVSTYLLDHPDVKVRLAGHTDDIGDDEYNQTLSAKRAKSAAAYLIAQGVEKQRILTNGYGERQPLVPEENEKARQINRRVEIEFYR